MYVLRRIIIRLVGCVGNRSMYAPQPQDVSVRHRSGIQVCGGTRSEDLLYTGMRGGGGNSHSTTTKLANNIQISNSR